MFGPLAGWSAAMLLAVDGYSVAFARIVQYQSLMLLTSALVVLILYRLREAAGRRARLPQPGRDVAGHRSPGPLRSRVRADSRRCSCWIVALRRHADRRGELLRATGVAAVLGAVLDCPLLRALRAAPAIPRHGHLSAATPSRHRRRGRGQAASPYNNLVDFFTRTTIYNSDLLCAAADRAHRRRPGHGLSPRAGPSVGQRRSACSSSPAWR